MSCSIDNIVKSSHNVEVAIFVEIAGVTCCVVSWGLGHVFLEETLVVAVESVHEGRRHW